MHLKETELKAERVGLTFQREETPAKWVVYLVFPLSTETTLKG